MTLLELRRGAWKILTGSSSGEMDRESGTLVGKMILGRAVLGHAEWWLMAATVALVAALKAYGLSDLQVFLILWVGNTVVSLGILFADRLSGSDITFMRAYRRMADAVLAFGSKVRAKSVLRQTVFDRIKSDLFYGFLVLCVSLVAIWLTFWLGAAYMAAFFSRELEKSLARRVLVVVVLSAVQMFLWTVIYTSGVEFFLPQ